MITPTIFEEIFTFSPLDSWLSKKIPPKPLYLWHQAILIMAYENQSLICSLLNPPPPKKKNMLLTLDPAVQKLYITPKVHVVVSTDCSRGHVARFHSSLDPHWRCLGWHLLAARQEVRGRCWGVRPRIWLREVFGVALGFFQGASWALVQDYFPLGYVNEQRLVYPLTMESWKELLSYWRGLCSDANC